MAIFELKTPRLKNEVALKNGIIAEIKRAEDAARSSGAPLVFRQKGRPPDSYSHWYVIWAKFKGVANEDRCRIIMDAIEESLGHREVVSTSIVMGLTPDDPLAHELVSA